MIHPLAKHRRIPEIPAFTKFADDVTCIRCKESRRWKVDEERFKRKPENVCVFCKNPNGHYWFEGGCNDVGDDNAPSRFGDSQLPMGSGKE